MGRRYARMQRRHRPRSHRRRRVVAETCVRITARWRAVTTDAWRRACRGGSGRWWRIYAPMSDDHGSSVTDTEITAHALFRCVYCKVISHTDLMGVHRYGQCPGLGAPIVSADSWSEMQRAARREAQNDRSRENDRGPQPCCRARR